MTIHEMYKWKKENRNEYEHIHRWLRKNKYIGTTCSFCGLEKERLEIALLKGKIYSRNVENYTILCVKCHRNYDSESLSFGAKNRKFTEEGRKKLSIGRKGRESKRKVPVESEGTLYKSVTEASRISKVSRTAILNCLAGRSKKAGNKKWKYVNRT